MNHPLEVTMSAKEGDTVRVHYHGTLEDGSTFDSSEGGDPIEFTIGKGEVIDGFERAVIGMEPGDKKRQKIEVADAYGERHPELVFEVERSNLPAGAEVSEGDFLEISLPDGSTAPVQVAGVSTKVLKLDANHPLAGKDLVFDLELVSIE
jgi:peptidylprolyl isomerase